MRIVKLNELSVELQDTVAIDYGLHIDMEKLSDGVVLRIFDKDDREVLNLYFRFKISICMAQLCFDVEYLNMADKVLPWRAIYGKMTEIKQRVIDIIDRYV